MHFRDDGEWWNRWKPTFPRSKVPPERAVVVEFESLEAAQKAYNSEAYQAAKKTPEVWTACCN